MYRYVLVHTSLHSTMYVQVRTLGKFSHDGTYQYVPVCTGIENVKKQVRVRTSTYFRGLSLYMGVHDGALQYMYQYILVRTGTYWYVLVCLSTCEYKLHTSVCPAGFVQANLWCTGSAPYKHWIGSLCIDLFVKLETISAAAAAASGKQHAAAPGQ
jgi:hypothetical protein